LLCQPVKADEVGNIDLSQNKSFILQSIKKNVQSMLPLGFYTCLVTQRTRKGVVGSSEQQYHLIKNGHFDI